MKKETRKRLRRRKRFNTLASFEESIGNLFETDSVQEMRNIKHHLNLTCLDHSLFVAYVSFRICKFMKWDFRSAARGGLLHDLFLYDWRREQNREGWHGTAHPKVALKNAEELCENQELEQLNHKEKDIIVSHMWPLTRGMPAHKESMVICMVDKVCAIAEMTLIFRLINFKSKYFAMV